MAFMWCHQGMKNFLSWGHWGHCWGRHWGPFGGRFGGCFCRFINASSIVSALLRCQTWHCRHGWRKSLCMKKKRKFFVSNSDQLWCPFFKGFSSLESSLWFIKVNPTTRVQSNFVPTLKNVLQKYMYLYHVIQPFYSLDLKPQIVCFLKLLLEFLWCRNFIELVIHKDAVRIPNWRRYHGIQ